jgi:hypothetical protein
MSMVPVKKTTRPGKKVERIYRLLLDVPLRDWSSYSLSKGSDTDIHWTLNIMHDLRKKGILEGSYVVRPKDLFMIWKERPITKEHLDYFVQDVRETVKGSNLLYAATTYYGENEVGKHLFPRRMDIYIKEGDLGKWKEYLSSKGLIGSGNFRILIADEHVFFNSSNTGDIRTVCVQQLIVDLFREGGVCSEAADMLIERFYDTL